MDKILGGGGGGLKVGSCAKCDHSLTVDIVSLVLSG